MFVLLVEVVERIFLADESHVVVIEFSQLAENNRCLIGRIRIVIVRVLVGFRRQRMAILAGEEVSPLAQLVLHRLLDRVRAVQELGKNGADRPDVDRLVVVSLDEDALGRPVPPRADTYRKLSFLSGEVALLPLLVGDLFLALALIFELQLT